MTSGPGLKLGAIPSGCDGRIDDWAAPLTTVVTSIGYTVAPIETPPTIEPASAGRPSVRANSSESRSLPPLMVSKCAAAS